MEAVVAVAALASLSVRLWTQSSSPALPCSWQGSANPVTPARAPVKCHTRRDKEHSTIIYESGDGGSPLLRLGWNKQDPRYMATILMDSSKVRFVCEFTTDIFFENMSKGQKPKGFGTKPVISAWPKS